MKISEKLGELSSVLLGHSAAAIILAGGSGSRFSSDPSLPKQLTELCGAPMIEYSLKAFDMAKEVCEIVVVSRKEDISVIEEIVKKISLSKPTKVVAGGKTRQESALCGFEASSEKSSFVAIHDAARPLITPEDIDQIIMSAYRSRATIAVSAAVDTPKIVAKSGYISEKAPDREKLYLAQTPQVFARDLYRTAAYYAREKGFEATDDASLLEYAGFRVKTFDTGKTNLKVTKPDDLILAQAIIQSRKSKETI